MELKQGKLTYGKRSQNSVEHWGAGVGRGLRNPGVLEMSGPHLALSGGCTGHM